MASERSEANELDTRSVGDLLREFAAIMRELRIRGVTRSDNTPSPISPSRSSPNR